MTDLQLRSLIGCILKFKLSDIIIINVTEDSVTFLNEVNYEITLTKEEFIYCYIPKLKIYLDQDDDSLVSIDDFIKYHKI